MWTSRGRNLWRCSFGPERVDHPGAHVVDRDESGDRRAARRKRLEDQRGVEARKGGAADVLAHIDRRHAERCGFPDHVDGKMLLLVPFERVRRKPIAREGLRHFADRDLILAKGEGGHGFPLWISINLSLCRFAATNVFRS